MSRELHRSCVARVPIFAGLTPGEQAEVAEFARPLHASRGQIIYTAGSDLRRLLVVHRGRIAMRHLTPEGREQVVRVVEEGDVVGEATFVTGDPPDHEAVATADSELCTFDHADLVDLVRRHPAIAVRMLQAVTIRLVGAERMLAAFATSEVGARLAAWLLDQPSVADGAGRRVVTLPMTKKEIATYLGTTPETMSRRLASLSRDGVIALAGRREIVLLDVPELEARAGGLAP
jgi:CRP/FNR family transcriptional regulator